MVKQLSGLEYTLNHQLKCLQDAFDTNMTDKAILESSDANSRKQEAEWKEKAIKELEEWYARQDEKLEKTKASNR